VKACGAGGGSTCSGVKGGMNPVHNMSTNARRRHRRHASPTESPPHAAAVQFGMVFMRYSRQTAIRNCTAASRNIRTESVTVSAEASQAAAVSGTASINRGHRKGVVKAPAGSDRYAAAGGPRRDKPWRGSGSGEGSKGVASGRTKWRMKHAGSP